MTDELLQRSPWQKHIKTLLYSHTVSSQRSSPSEGPLCKHILWVAVSNSCSLASEFRVSIILPHQPVEQGTASTPMPASEFNCVRLVYLKRSLQLPKSPRERQLKQRLTTLSEQLINIDKKSITITDLLLIVRSVDELWMNFEWFCFRYLPSKHFHFYPPMQQVKILTIRIICLIIGHQAFWMYILQW